MAALRIVGIALLVLGVLSLAYQGISYTKSEKVLEVGPITATKETKKTIPLPPILGGRRSRGRPYPSRGRRTPLKGGVPSPLCSFMELHRAAEHRQRKRQIESPFTNGSLKRNQDNSRLSHVNPPCSWNRVSRTHQTCFL
jgi:hypothetical protein